MGDAVPCRINHEVIAIPWMIVTLAHCTPVGRNETGNFARSGFDTTAMLIDVGAKGLDLHDSGASSQTRVAPGVSRQQPGIYGVANHIIAQTQIVLDHRIGRAIPRVVERSGRDA